MFKDQLIIMLKKYFGTDGIRGRSNKNFITPEMMIKFAMASSVASDMINIKKTVVIAKDTRLSGYMLEFALTSGFISMGVNVVLVGPVPTPAVAMLVKSLRADMGIMISASHNPYFDNGIKLFNANGYKISAKLEQKIESLIDTDMSEFMATYDQLGKAIKLDDAKGRYIEKLKHYFPQNHKLEGIKIVIDCANGAAYDIAPKVFRELGAEIITYAVNPDGFNINKDCGVLSPAQLSKMVLEHQADLGIALDGDADRILIVDENGKIIEAEQIIALLATNMLEINYDGCKQIVTTILANTGLDYYLNKLGIELLRTDVGDKNVASMMQKHGCPIGGESSGHIIIGKNEATGDGIKVALEILAIYKNKKNIPISQLLDKFTPIPQITNNITYNYKLYGQNCLNNNKIKILIKQYQEQYKNKVKIILRLSGTEPVIRLLVESVDQNLAKMLCTNITKALINILKID